MLSSPTNIVSCLAEAGSLCWFPGEAYPALDTGIVCGLPPGTSGGPWTQQPADNSGLVVSEFLRGNCLLQCVVGVFSVCFPFPQNIKKSNPQESRFSKTNETGMKKKPRVHGGEENNACSCCVFTWGASSFTCHRFCKIISINMFFKKGKFILVI